MDGPAAPDTRLLLRLLPLLLLLPLFLLFLLWLLVLLLVLFAAVLSFHALGLSPSQLTASRAADCVQGFGAEGRHSDHRGGGTLKKTSACVLTALRSLRTCLPLRLLG